MLQPLMIILWIIVAVAIAVGGSIIVDRTMPGEFAWLAKLAVGVIALIFLVMMLGLV